MISRDGENLVFGLSTPRAGSTLLSAILGSHSQVLSPPEPWFLLPLLGLRNERVIAAAAYDHDLAQRALREFLDEDTFYAAAGAFAHSAYTTLAGRAKKPIFVDHNGRYYHIARQLRRLFPKSLHLWIKRNPLDVVASYKSTWSVTPEQLFGETVTLNSFDVTASFTILVSHFDEIENAYVFKYEDLASRPEPVVAGLCAALNIPFEDGMLEFAQNDSLMQSYSQSIFGDKKIHRSSGIHGKSVGAWRATLAPDEVRLTLGALGVFPFVRLGYEDELEQALAYAGFDRASLTEYGRLPEYERALATYPSAMSGGLAAGQQMLGGGMRAALEEKEAMIQLLAKEAQTRLRLLEAAEAERAMLERQLEEKEAVMQELAAAADTRLRLLQASEAEVTTLRQQLYDMLAANPPTP